MTRKLTPGDVSRYARKLHAEELFISEDRQAEQYFIVQVITKLLYLLNQGEVFTKVGLLCLCAGLPGSRTVGC